jgi:hypothetical protein
MRSYEFIFIIIAVLMSLVYCGIGAMFLFGKVDVFRETPILNYICGSALVLYGLFRGWRVYKKVEDFRE